MYQLKAQLLVLEERKPDASPLQHLLQFTEVFPKQMPAEVLVEFVYRVGLGASKDGSHSGRLDHVHQHQVLAADELKVAHKPLGEHWVIKCREKYQQCPPPQPEPNEGEKLLVIGGNRPWCQGVECIAAGTEVGLPGFGAHESFD